MGKDTFYFMRKNEVDVMRYLPKFLSKSPTFKNAQDSLSWKHEHYRLKLVDTARQFFLETATWGLSDWEKFLGITPREGASFEARKAVCRVKLRGLETMTPSNTIRLIEEFMTRGHAEVEELGDNKIKLVLDNGVFYWNELFKALWEFLPAHLEWSLEFDTELEHDIYLGGVNNYTGERNIDNARLDDVKNEVYIGGITQPSGDKAIGLDRGTATPVNNISVGCHIGIGGYVEIKAAEDDEDDFDADFEKMLWERWRAWNRNPLVKIYGHHFDLDEGDIDPDAPDEPEIFPDGNFLRLYYKFPNTKRLRYTTLSDPRSDLKGADINAVGNYAAANRLILNWRGDATTGIKRALLIERTVEKIF